MIDRAISKLLAGHDLNDEEAYGSMKEIMSGSVNNATIASFLTSLKIKGETSDEIFSFAKVIRENATPFDTKIDRLIDMCGTGGDGAFTFNISTTASFVAAAAGVKVAKHGNRSVTSRSGGADVLEALGIKIDKTSEQTIESIENSGLGFLFAQKYHSSFKNVMPVRKELGFKTVFNLLGPLSNPAKTRHHLMGIYDKNITSKIAKSLRRLGTKRAMVVCGDDGLDEITLTCKTHVSELNEGKIMNYTFDPHDYGFEYCDEKEIKGGMPEENASILIDVLRGKIDSRRDITILNAGAAIYVSGEAKNLKDGFSMAQRAIDSGAAFKRFCEFSK